jgi:peptidoglycan L-alanyl-D-glutamate endopeptidase CwlK
LSSLVAEQNAFAHDVARLIFAAADQGFLVTFGEAYRTAEQQAIYVASGKSKTQASNHLRRLAVDFNFFLDGVLCYDKAKLQALGTFWESLNLQNRWGGNFKSFLDTPHFERHVT